MEKFDLLHKVEDLEEENKRQQGFQKQLGNSEQKLLSLISEIKKYLEPRHYSPLYYYLT